MEKFNLKTLRKEIIGLNTKFTTAYGEKIMTYADYTASGKTLKFVEKYLMEIEKYYANTHTEDDITGELMTNLLHNSEKIIKKELNASENCFVIPGGSGATGAIENFSKIIGLYIPPATKMRFNNIMKKVTQGKYDIENLPESISADIPVVFIGPYEHHSNILMWRESLVEVVEIGLNDEGYLDIKELEEKVSDMKYSDRFKIGSFSAASNVTGIMTNVYEVSKILHKNNALACFDFAASGPYVEINMNKNEESYFDAVYFSPHKFLGGPGSCGILVINKKLYDTTIPPTVSGGGTVDYVSDFGQDYVHNVEDREKAGTPGVIQIIKAALAIQLKSRIGIDTIEEIELRYTEKFFNFFKENKNVEILGPLDASKRVSIISFMIKYQDKYLHPRYVTKLMNDLFGLQSRAGCACAGPYGHKLLGIDKDKSSIFRNVIQVGVSSLKPGWVRINLHYSMTEEEIEFIINAIDFVSKNAYLFLKDYTVDIATGAWINDNKIPKNEVIDGFCVDNSFKFIGKALIEPEEIDISKEYKKYLIEAEKMASDYKENFTGIFGKYNDEKLEALNWYYFINSKNNI